MDSIIGFLKHWDLVGFVIAGFISVIIALLINGFKSLFSMKRKKYCISKSLVSSTVYQETEEDGFEIIVSYHGKRIDRPLTVLNVRLRNDGEEDILFSQRFSRPVFIAINEANIIDVKTYSLIEGVNPIAVKNSVGSFSISWDLLKRDEFLYLKIIIDGLWDGKISDVHFDIRADGINQIKTPEYKVGEVMIPIFIATGLISILLIIFYPSGEMFVDIISMKLFYILCLLFSTLIFLISALIQRIKWLKEN